MGRYIDGPSDVGAGESCRSGRVGRCVALVVLLTAALSTAVPRAQPAPGCTRSPLVVTNATLWTPEGLLSDHEVTIANGRIEAVGRSGQLSRPAGGRVLDASHDTLLPGLIDAHAHLTLAGAAAPILRNDPRGQLFAATARQLLRSGVTSARIHLWDLRDGPAFARDAEADCSPTPRLDIGGPGFIGGSPTLAAPQAWGAADEEDGRRKVHQIRAAGAKWIALHELHKLDPGITKAIVAEARAAGLRIMAAAELVEDLRLALDAGVDTLEYLDRSAAPLYPADLVNRMRVRGGSLALVPPIGYYHRYERYRRDPSVLDPPRLIEFMPADSGTFMLDDLRAQRSKPPSTAGAAILESYPVLAGKFHQLRKAGLTLIVGTDCGSTSNIHADAIWWELETWRSLGVPPGQVIGAATAKSAAVLGLDGVGLLAPGSRADFVLYRGALDNGRFDVDRVRSVAKGGRMFVDEGRWVE